MPVLCHCLDFSLAVMSRGHSLVAEHGLLISVASLVLEHRLQNAWTSVVVVPRPWSTGSGVRVQRLSGSAACGNFPNQGPKLCLLYWQADSPPLSHQGSPSIIFLIGSWGNGKAEIAVLYYALGNCVSTRRRAAGIAEGADVTKLSGSTLGVAHSKL